MDSLDIYADDSMLTASGKTIEQIENKLNSDMEEVDPTKQNTVNSDKTEAKCLTLYYYSIYCWALSIYNYFNFIPIPFYHGHTLLSYKSKVMLITTYLVIDKHFKNLEVIDLLHVYNVYYKHMV